MLTIFFAGIALTGAMTNMEMIESVVSEAMIPIASQVAGEGADTIVLEVNGEHPGSWLLEQTAVSVLNNAGLTVTNAREEGSWKLRIRPMEMSVTYARTERSWILGGKRIPRLATCQLSAFLEDSLGNVVLAAREGAVLNSTVSAGEIALLESVAEKWVNGVHTGEESGNLLEPLVVTGVVTALVYLFYSSRN